MKCYICSRMLSVLPESYQECLRLLAEGRVSDAMTAADRDARVVSLRTRSRGSQRMNQNILKWDSRISFTGIEIDDGKTSTHELPLALHLNPSYQGHFPLGSAVYDGWLRDFWEHMEQLENSLWRQDIMLLNHEGIAIYEKVFQGATPLTETSSGRSQDSSYAAVQYRFHGDLVNYREVDQGLLQRSPLYVQSQRKLVPHSFS